MIKKSLKAKLIISYLVVALLTVLVVTVYIRLNSGQELLNLVTEQQASLLEEEAANYYQSMGSWDGFIKYYTSISHNESNSVADQQFPQQPNHGPAREIRGQHGMVDADYKVIIPFKNYQVGDVVPADSLKEAVPVEVDSSTVAYIIPDGSYQFNLSPEESGYLQKINQAILIAAGAGILGAVLMGGILAGIFLKPIRNLITASQKMAGGNLEQRVPVHSQDELGQLSLTFNQMSADLASADRQRRQMTEDITHDLSTPLQVIAGYIEMLENDEVTLTPQRIRIIMNEIELLRRLVGDLSLLTTADAKELAMEMEAIEPKALLEHVHSTYEPIARKENIALMVDVEPQTPAICVDKDRMVQVISNLMDNALRYTPSGGTIQITAGMIRGKTEIRVKDNGSGIHPDDLPYVFDRFYRADKARDGNSGKMGLGLAIAKALVIAQGGSIRVESGGKDPGTAFVMQFKPIG